jgi:MFS family permease
MIAKLNEKKSYPWIVVGLLWFVALLNYLDRQMLSTMKSAMMDDIPELAKAENFGLLMAVFLWIYALMSPVSGIIADRFNRKRIIIGSLFIWSGVTMAMGYATTFNQIYILRGIMGFREAFYIPAAFLNSSLPSGKNTLSCHCDSYHRNLFRTGARWFWSRYF